MVAVLLLQTAGFVWIGSDKFTTIHMRLAVLEKATDDQSEQGDRIIVLEQSLMTIKEDLQYIKQMLRDQKGGGGK